MSEINTMTLEEFNQLLMEDAEAMMAELYRLGNLAQAALDNSERSRRALRDFSNGFWDTLREYRAIRAMLADDDNRKRSGKMEIASFERREWIDPWNDRRPMTEDWVLVTIEEDGCRYVTEDCFANGWLADGDAAVIAWMPLPEPMGGYQPLNAEKFSEEWTRQ